MRWYLSYVGCEAAFIATGAGVGAFAGGAGAWPGAIAGAALGQPVCSAMGEAGAVAGGTLAGAENVYLREGNEGRYDNPSSNQKKRKSSGN